MEEKVTILVPAYNAEKRIKRCIKSLMKQTYKNIEIVVCNDGSTDRTLEILEELKREDSRVVIYTKQNEKSISKTRSFLLSKITSEYFCFVDSDDFVTKDYVETLLKVLKENDADLSSCNYSIQIMGLPIINWGKGKTKIYENDFVEDMILAKSFGYSVWNKMFKTSLLKGVGFNTDLNFGEDLFFCFDYVSKCKKIAYTTKKLYHYIWHFSGLTHQKFGKNQIKFLETLKEYLNKEINENSIKTFKAWIAFTSCYYLRCSKKNKETISDEKRKEFREDLEKYKDYFINNKKARKLFRFFFKLIYRKDKTKDKVD